MSSPSRIHNYSPGQHTVKPLPFKAHKVDGFSAENLEQHYERGYGGAITRLNQVELAIAENNSDTPAGALRLEQQLLENEVILHEIYFDSIGEDGGVALVDEDLNQALKASFGSVEQWRADFRLLAASAVSGWVVLAWSERFGRLVNTRVTHHTQSLSGSNPVLVLDMAEHAYSQDFNSDQLSYVAAFIRNINWAGASRRFQLAIGATQSEEKPNDDSQISVAALKARIDQGDDVMVLDVRHSDDRVRYKWRIMESDFRDSFNIKSWANDLPKNKPVVVYCMYGFWVSQQAAEELRAYGVDAISLSGGITSWRAMGYQTSKNEY